MGKYEPNLILSGHRIVLAAGSKFLHRKFKKNPNPNDVILVEAVEHKHLNYFITLLYEGIIDIPEPDLDCFQATLRALDVVLDAKLEERTSDNNIGDITREELVSSSSLVHTSPKTNYTPSKSSRSSSIEQDETTIEIPNLKNEVVSKSKTATPEKQTQDSNPALTATETGSDVKPDTKVFQSNDGDGDFMSRISKGGKRLFIEEFPQASSPASNGTDLRPPSPKSNASSSSVPKKARVIETPRLPAIKRSEIGKPVRAQMGLFWIEQNNPALKTKDELSQMNCNVNFKELLITDDRSKAYFGFENEKCAKNYVDNAIVTNPDKFNHPRVVLSLPLQQLRPPSPIERKVRIEGVPKDWPGVPSILRMFKKNKMIVPLKDISFDATKRHALLTLYDQQSVDRTLMIVHGLDCGMYASMM